VVTGLNQIQNNSFSYLVSFCPLELLYNLGLNQKTTNQNVDIPEKVQLSTLNNTNQLVYILQKLATTT